MVKEIQCNKHTKIKFSIPENIQECISLNSFQEIKLLELHLENYPNCRMVERRISN